MKTLVSLVAGLACIASALAAEPSKPLVSLVVKKQVVDSDHDLRGKQGSSKEKTLVLRVEVTNVSGAQIDGAELSGTALISRAGDLQEKIIKESLSAMKVPALKPNEKVTLELGKLRLTELELRGRKSEESLEEWKVVCTRAQTQIGQAVSSENYQSLEQKAAKPSLRPQMPGRRKQ